MNKKKILIIGAAAVAVIAVFLALNNSADIPVVIEKDAVTGESIYTNTEYGFSVVYSNEWQGPSERVNADIEDKDSLINAIFLSTSTSEAIVIQGKPGDTENFNDFAKSLDTSYQVITVGGLPALRYEYVGPINEEGTLYAKTVMFVVKGLKAGSVTIAYQKIAAAEAGLKAVDLTKLNNFVARVTFK